jgi:hypothetical protein
MAIVAPRRGEAPVPPKPLAKEDLRLCGQPSLKNGSSVTLVKNNKITKRTQFKNRTTRHPR